jgi:putative flippase GtrA
MKIAEAVAGQIIQINSGLVQLIKYGLVSAVALAVDMGLLYALTEWAHFNYLL